MRRLGVLHLLFFVSGALGLVYEVLWMRRLTVVFGATTVATAVTLSAFFLGLAAGSAVLGAQAWRWRRPLVAFGVLEAGVAVGAVLVPVLLALGRPLHAIVPGPLLAVGALFLPTFCMGGTLPVLARIVAAGPSGLGVRVGGLYVVNLLGATAGALAVPFVLLPSLGLEHGSRAAVAGSLTVAAVAVAWGVRATLPPEAMPAEGVPRGASPPGVLAWSGLSGVVTLALQTLWTRMFALVHENSAYSFAVVVVVFLLGLAGGAELARWALRRGRAPVPVLGLSWGAAGALVILTPRIFAGLTGGLEYLSAVGWPASAGRLLLVATVTLLPATVCLGLALPLLMEMAGRRTGGDVAPALGRLLGINTLGAIAGPWLATFVLGPHLGLWASVALVGGLAAAAGAAVISGWARAAVVGAAAAALGLAGPLSLPPARVRAERGERLVSVREGSVGTTAVLEDAHDRWITVNNSYVLGGTATAGEERWQADLPLLLHPSPKRVAFLGLGTGITAGAALRHPVERVIALEIVPEVVDAARADFADANARVVDDRRVTVAIDDARHHLARTAERFDVVVGDLLVPWRPGEAALYTQEHFEAVRRALAPGGVFCQWLPVYQLSGEQLAILLRTFATVFPTATVWRGNFLADEGALAVVGHRDTGAIEAAGVDDRVRALAPALDPESPFLAHPAGFWLFLLGPLRADAAWLAEDPRRNRDARPWIELLSPLTHAGPGRAPGTVEAAVDTDWGRSPLRGLDATHRDWVTLGAALGQASLIPGAEGEREVLRLLQRLPVELRHVLEVGDSIH